MSISKIEIGELAEKLGKKPEPRTLPNGKTVEYIIWKGDDLKKISNLLHNEAKSDVVEIDGAAPTWLAAALAHECHPSYVKLNNSASGYVDIGCKKPAATPAGENINWKVSHLASGEVMVTGEMADSSVPLRPEDLANITPPQVEQRSVVVINGRMPNWLATSLAMAYHGTCAAVGVFQAGVGATICWTHSADIELGSICAKPSEMKIVDEVSYEAPLHDEEELDDDLDNDEH